MKRKRLKEERNRLMEEKFLLDYNEARDKLYAKNKAFRELIIENDKLYDLNELIWKMEDGDLIERKYFELEELEALLKYHVNTVRINDYLMKEFYRMGKRDLYKELKRINAL